MAVPFVGKIKSYVGWTIAGFADRLSSRFTGRTCSLAKHVAMKIDQCEPWTDHFEATSIKDIDTALRERDFDAARFLLAFGDKEGARKYCVNMARDVVEFIASGEEITFSMLSCLE
jgi:hypothetical protein